VGQRPTNQITKRDNKKKTLSGLLVWRFFLLFPTIQRPPEERASDPAKGIGKRITPRGIATGNKALVILIAEAVKRGKKGGGEKDGSRRRKQMREEPRTEITQEHIRKKMIELIDVMDGKEVFAQAALGGKVKDGAHIEQHKEEVEREETLFYKIVHIFSKRWVIARIYRAIVY
jgi:hypothetical protein